MARNIASSWHLVVALCGLVLLAGCHKSKPPESTSPLEYTRELPVGQLALRKLSPSEYPDFSKMANDRFPLTRAIDYSLKYLATPTSERAYPYLDITHERAVVTLIALREIVNRETVAPLDWNAEIRSHFEVYQSIGAPKPDNSGYTGEVLFTGYFTPIYDASLTRGGAFQYPLYRRPPDLVSDEVTRVVAGRRPADGAPIVPYYPRATIEGPKSPLAGQELVWLNDRWAAYIITVQGSALLKMADGTQLEVGYAGTNGLEYVSPGRAMVKDGLIPQAQLSLKTMGAYFQAHPAAMDKYLWLNPRTVFFTERPGGPYGSLNVPVSPFASIATDKKVYPPAMPAFLSVPLPSSDGGTRPFSGFMLDQDTGGAIRAAGRCDIYMGIGEAAGQLAGRQLHAGALYYLAVKPELMPPAARAVTGQ